MAELNLSQEIPTFRLPLQRPSHPGSVSPPRRLILGDTPQMMSDSYAGMSTQLSESSSSKTNEQASMSSYAS